MTADEFCDPRNTSMLTAMANQVIIDESPVSYDLIASRIKEACGITKITPKIKERINYLIRSTRIKPAPDGNVIFFWKPGSDPMAYDFYRTGTGDLLRDPSDVHPCEAACAMLEAIREEFGMPEESAYVAGAHKLGYTRMVPSVKELMERGMMILQNENAVTLNINGMLEA